MTNAKPPSSGRVRTTVSLIAALIAALAIPITAAGRVMGLWPSIPAIFLAFLATAVAMLFAIILGLIGVLRRGGRPLRAYPVAGSLLALIVGLIVLVPVGSFVRLGFKYPPIHDVSTDTVNPPQFVAILAERQATHAPNSTVFNPATAGPQRRGFPDLTTRELALPAADAFSRALAAAKAMGWRIVAFDPSVGRIEASDVTFWSGFVDDVVIRVKPIDASRTAIDVRSESRLGGGDAGKNGMRIRAYLAKLT
jgi:hypothetical protein